VLVAIAAASAFGSVGGPIVGEGASFGHRPRQISAASAFVLPSTKQCVGDRELTIQLRTLPHVRWIGATVDVNGARFKTIKRSQLTRPVRLTGLPSAHFVLSITARTSTGRSVTATRTYQTCVPVSKIVEPVTPVSPVTPIAPVTPVSPVTPPPSETEPPHTEPPAGVEAGSYSGSDTQGYGMSFYVSPDRSAVQNVVVSTTVMGCTPSKTIDDHFEVASIAIDSEGDFSSTTEQEGVIEHEPAKFKYTISGHLSGAGASGSIREDISFSNGTEYSCTTSGETWSLTRDSVQTEASFPPAAGSYSGTDHQGYGMTFYVSPGGGYVQNVLVSTTVMGCTPSEEITDHFEVASVVIKPDGSFSSTTEQEGVLKHLPAKFKYTFSGQFHGTGSAGVVRVAGTLREDITYENGSKFECTTNGETWSLTRDSVQTEASFPPAAGSYSGTDHQGYGMTFEVTSGGTKLQNVSVPTVVGGCTPANETDLAFVIKEATIGSDGSFTAKETESATVFGVTATVTYEFSGQFHGTGSGGKVRVAGTLRETAVDKSGKTFECTSNGQAWEAQV
jgi:hypothetical protein